MCFYMHDQVESGSRGKMVKGQTHYEDRDAMPSAWLVFLQTYVKKNSVFSMKVLVFHGDASVELRMYQPETGPQST